jgi:hypothetical protein
MAAAPRTRRKAARKSAPKRKPIRTLPRERVAAAVVRMAAPSGAARLEAGKALAVTAARDPTRVYPHFDHIAALLDSDCKIVRWNALQIIASLAATDRARKIEAILDRYLAFVQGGDLISAANAIRGAARIAACQPALVDRIVSAILGAEHATFRTAECRNVAIGEALDAFAVLGPAVCRRADVAAFTGRATANPRGAVAKRARRLLAATVDE